MSKTSPNSRQESRRVQNELGIVRQHVLRVGATEALHSEARRLRAEGVNGVARKPTRDEIRNINTALAIATTSNRKTRREVARRFGR